MYDLKEQLNKHCDCGYELADGMICCPYCSKHRKKVHKKNTE